jgi:hypothetical protein
MVLVSAMDGCETDYFDAERLKMFAMFVLAWLAV